MIDQVSTDKINEAAAGLANDMGEEFEDLKEEVEELVRAREAQYEAEGKEFSEEDLIDHVLDEEIAEIGLDENPEVAFVVKQILKAAVAEDFAA